MNINEFNIFIVDWFKSIHPTVTIIKRNPNARRPKLPYFDYKVTTRSNKGQPDRGYVADDGISGVRIHKDVSISIRGYGYGAEDMLNTLENSLALNSTLELFSINKVGIKSPNMSVTDISVLYEQEWEEQFLFEPVFSYAEEILEDVGFIDTVEIDKTINMPD